MRGFQGDNMEKFRAWRQHRLQFAATMVLMLFATALSIGTASASDSQRTVRLGNSYTFTFQGNPSTGYIWRLDQSASTGLDAVRLQSLGYRRNTKNKGGKAIVGGRSPFAFRLTCVKVGFAHLIFEYERPWEGNARETHEHWARCE